MSCRKPLMGELVKQTSYTSRTDMCLLSSSAQRAFYKSQRERSLSEFKDSKTSPTEDTSQLYKTSSTTMTSLETSSARFRMSCSATRKSFTARRFFSLLSCPTGSA